MNLKNEILRRWSLCKNEHERGELLGEIESARHEIRIEYLHSEPELRKAISKLESNLTNIMRGKFIISSINHFNGEEGTREAPIVGLAGYIAMLLALKAEHKERMYDELKNNIIHSNRIQDAIDFRKKPLDVICRICKAPIDTKCY